MLLSERMCQGASIGWRFPKEPADGLESPNLCQTPLFTPFTIGIKKKLPCYFNAGENSPVAVSPDPVSPDVLVAAADL
jgi:hypothetical protein